MDYYTRILRDKLGQDYVVLFEMGKMPTPLLILTTFEMDILIKAYQKELAENGQVDIQAKVAELENKIHNHPACEGCRALLAKIARGEKP